MAITRSQLRKLTELLGQNSLIGDVYSANMGMSPLGGADDLGQLLSGIDAGAAAPTSGLGQQSLFSPAQLQSMTVPKAPVPKIPAAPAAPASPGFQQLSLFDDAVGAAATPPPNFVLQGTPYNASNLQLPAVVQGGVPATTQAATQAASGAAGAGGKAAGIGAKIGGATKGVAGKLGGLFSKLSAAAPGISTATQIVDSGTAIADLAGSTQNIGELERKLLADSYSKGAGKLSNEDIRTIQTIRRGQQNNSKGDIGAFLTGAGKGAGGAAITAALGLIPGMQWLLPLAAAQLATSGVRGITTNKQGKQNELADLYNRLQQANASATGQDVRYI